MKFLWLLICRLGAWQPAVVFGSSILVSGFEIVGVGVVYWFAGLVFDPNALQNIPWVGDLVDWFDATHQYLIVVTGIAIVFLFLVKSAAGFAAVTLRVRFAGRLTNALSHDFISLYAHQNYEWMQQRHSSEFVKNLLSECEIVGSFVLLPVIAIAADGVFILLMLGFLFWIDPIITLSVILLFSAGYALMFAVTNPTMSRAGERRVQYAQDRTKAVVEFFGGLREIIISGRWTAFVEKFLTANRAYISQQNRLRALPAAPVFGMQFLAISAAVGAICYLNVQQRDTTEIIATMTLFAAAGLRMMPVFNSIVRELLTARGYWQSFLHLSAEWRNLLRNKITLREDVEPYEIGRLVALRNVTYSYPGAAKPAVSNLTIEIPKGSSIGIAGTTGAGKSTAVEILLGLLRPQEGTLEIDDHPLADDEIQRWHCTLGYVPQRIYLSDDSVTRNIAFGIEDSEIDEKAVKRAAMLAQIHDFIEAELESGYDTKVGERGVRLAVVSCNALALPGHYIIIRKFSFLTKPRAHLMQHTINS